MMFDRILVPLDRSPLVECILPHAVALSSYLGSPMILFHVLSLPDSRDRPQRLPVLCSQSRPALPHLTPGKPCRHGDYSQVW
jgi:nucleotide-binding universal stress UspA family protein